MKRLHNSCIRDAAWGSEGRMAIDGRSRRGWLLFLPEQAIWVTSMVGMLMGLLLNFCTNVPQDKYSIWGDLPFTCA